MPTATSQTIPERSRGSNAVDDFVSLRITETCRALWWEEIIRRTLILVVGLIVAFLSWVVIDHWVYSAGVFVRGLTLCLVVGGAAWYVVRQIWPVLTSTIRPEYAARSLERDLPEMKQQLTSYVTLRAEMQSNESGTGGSLAAGTVASGLHDRVVRSIGSIAAGRLRSYDALPTEATATLKWWIMAAAALAMLMAYTLFSPKSTVASASRLIAPFASIEPAKRVAISDVKPGDVEAIAGRSIAVSATVIGLRTDEEVVCRWQSSSRKEEFVLAYNEEDRRFEGELKLSHSDSGQIPYSIHAGDDGSDVFRLSVKNLPVVAIESVHYQPPAYTGETAHTSSSASITAVEGTLVTISARTNRPVKQATIEFNPRLLGETVRATAGSKTMAIDASGTQLKITFPLRQESGPSAAVQLDEYRIRVRDEAGQDNPQPIVYPIRVIADLPPEISIVLPRKSPKSMGVKQQQIIELHAMDPDFGLKRVELKISRGIDVIKNPTLWSDDDGAKGNHVTEYRFRPSEHGLRVGDVVQITGVATDNRMIPGNESIQPNVSVTDPVEIRIIDDQPAPDPQGADDGLSEPDQRPASDHSEDKMGGEKSKSQDGDQQQGGSGGKGESSQQQEGEGGDASGEGQSGEGSPDGSPNEGQDGQGQGGEGQKNDSRQPGENTADGDGSGDSSGDQASGNKQPPGSMKNEGSDSAGDSEGTSPENSGDQPQENNGPAGQNNGPAGENDPTAGENQTPEGQQNGTPGEGASQNQDGSAQGTGGDGESKGPPKHDGETFEKIRDYLDKKKQERESQASKGQGADEQAGSESDPRSGDENQSAGSNDGKSQDQSAKQDDGGEASGNASDDKDQTQDASQSSSNDSKSDPSPQGDPGDKSDQKSGGSRSGEQPKGDSQSMNKGSGSDQANDANPNSREGAGDDAAGNDAAGEKDAGSEGGGQNDAGKENTGEQGAGQDPASSAKSDQASPSQDKTGQDKTGQDKTGQGKKGQDGAGPDKADRKGDPGSDQASNNGDPGAKSDGDSSSQNDGAMSDQGGDSAKQDGQQQGDEKSEGSDQGAASQTKSEDQTSNESANQDGQPSQQGKPSQNSPPRDATQGGNQSASGSDAGSGEAGDGPPAPEAADMEYTKKATDMVLDYLDETRDKPDRDLLKELDWTEKDLQQFADRWKKTRQMDAAKGNANGQDKSIRDALESLGLRPPADNQRDVRRDAADDLRSIRDSGNRRSPPAAYKDVFDAFRRGIGRQK